MDETKKAGKPLLTPFLIIVILVVSFVAGSLWQKVKTLEKGTTASDTGTVAGTQEENKLSVENLKKYAQDLKLDTKKFDKCLDESEKKTEVEKQVNEGSSEGISGTPGFLLNGRLISGALPFEMFKTLIDFELKTGFSNTTTYPEEVQQLVEQGRINTKKVEVKTEGYPVKGAPNGKILLVEYSDFECPYCARVIPTVEQILEAYPNEIKLVFKQYPLPIHADAQKAAEASLCAQAQGKFWEYHDKLFESAN